MPPKDKNNQKRYIKKLVARTLTQRTSSSQSTTTRHHITASGRTTTEVPRLSIPKPVKEVCIEPILDAPQDENAVDVNGDGMENPADKVHDPEVLTEEQTQVSGYLFAHDAYHLTVH
jgi:ribosomal protein L32